MVSEFVAWGSLVLAIVSSIAGATFAKESQNFEDIGQTIATFINSNICEVFTIIAFSTIDLGTGWVLYTAGDVVGVILVGIVFFHETITTAKIVGIVVTLVGVSILVLVEADVWSPWPASWNKSLWAAAPKPEVYDEANDTMTEELLDSSVNSSEGESGSLHETVIQEETTQILMVA